jgi:hypothetical protein
MYRIEDYVLQLNQAAQSTEGESKSISLRTYKIKSKAVPLHDMEALADEGNSYYPFLTLELYGGECQRHAPAAFTLGIGPRYPLNRRLGGLQSWSGRRLEEKSFRLYRGSNLDRPVVQPVARHYTDWAN